MKCNTYPIRSGFDGEKCLVHARCCYTPEIMVATAQYLNVAGCDAFSGLLMSVSRDEGKTWSEFEPQMGLAAIEEDGLITVPSDATPMYHKATGKILLLGHTVEYRKGELYPTGNRRYTSYSVYDPEKNEFTKMKFVEMPEGFERCGNGSGQSLELPNGELLIPAYYTLDDHVHAYSMIMRCSFDGETVKLLEMGNSLTVDHPRGMGETSIILHEGMYYLTIRTDDYGYVAKSEDGLHYDEPELWRWDDGEILENYNTQQHWMQIDGELYLVYTRRGANNDHVFRHRAPLFAAKVENMRLIRDTEFVVVPERGARLGNFCAAPYKDGKAMVMAAEWMQPVNCTQYGSDNSIFFSIIEK